MRPSALGRGFQISLTVPAFLVVVCTAAWAVWHFTDGKRDSWYEVSLQVCLVAPDCSSGTLPSGDAGSLRQYLWAQEADWIPVTFAPMSDVRAVI